MGCAVKVWGVQLRRTDRRDMNTPGRFETSIKFDLIKLNEEYHWEDPGVDERIILKFLRKNV